MIVAGPAAEPVKLTEQLPAARVQLAVLKEPEPVEVQPIVPVGVIGVSAVELSATVAVHVEAWPITTGLVQTTVVELVRTLMVMLAVELVLVL